MINAFQSLGDEVVSETVLRLASLQSWHSLSYGRLQMELCLNQELIKKWKRMIKREAKEATKGGELFDPSSKLEVKFLRNLIEEFLEQVDDACVLYCERFMEFLIDLLSQLPTRRYLRPLVADVAVVAKCHLSALYKHEKGKLFAQLVDLLQFYEKFEINDHVGTQLTDDEVLQSHYDRFQSFQLLAFKKIPKLRELALANIGAINKRADLSKKLSKLPPMDLRDLVCHKLKLISEEDPWSERVDFLIEVMVSFFEKQQSQKEAINALPLYPNEQITYKAQIRSEWNAFKEHDVLFLLSIHPSFEPLSAEEAAKASVPQRLGLQNVRGCEIIEVRDEEGTLMNDFTGRIKRDEWKPPKGELRNVTVALDTAQYHMDVSNIAEKGADDVYGTFNILMRRKPKENNFKAILESIRDLMNEYCIVPDWLHNVFLGYGNPSAAQWTNMPDLLEMVDFKDTFLDADHLKDSFRIIRFAIVCFINPDGSENLQPMPPFRIKLPKMQKGGSHALIGNKISGVDSADGVSMEDTLIVEAYTPPDPGPYPQDQPKQNSVRFTPTQVLCNYFFQLHCVIFHTYLC
uniref:Intron-binding protein aquarius n=1 Tax=Quercus lobata TaxID=97700 RepID=A0A7N2M6F9_QUELO